MPHLQAEPIGWYLYAEAYAISASKLYDLDIRHPHKDSPPRFLYYHSIELFLKAYLAHKGLNEGQIRALNHKMELLGKECISRGLRLRKSIIQALTYIDLDGNMIAARYIKIGTRRHLTKDALAETASYIHAAIKKKFVAAGIHIRSAK